MPALTLSSLVVYPIKSAGGISVREWEVDAFGLRYDRRWMVVDCRGRMVTQRTHPRLALVRPAIEGDRLVIRAPGLEQLALPLRPADAVSTTVTVWGDQLPRPLAGRGGCPLVFHAGASGGSARVTCRTAPGDPRSQSTPLRAQG